jgi:hypothetical protein
MRPVSAALVNKAIDVLAEAFRESAGVLWIIKKDQNRDQRLRALCKFCLTVSIEKGGAYITNADDGVVLIFPSTARMRWRIWLRSYFQLGRHCIGWDRAWSMIKREMTIRNKRPEARHLYCWMIGSDRAQRGVQAAVEMKNFVLRMSDELRLPIVAEATSVKALNLYGRYGFRVYDQWDVPAQKLTMWFMIREVSMSSLASDTSG